MVLAAGGTFAPLAAAVAQQETAERGKPEASQRPPPPGRTGLPLPRFVSLRASEVNLRSGPGTRYPIDWVYRRSGMPVEIIDEFDTWRRIRDWQGTEGWIHQSMVQGRRGILIVGQRRTLKRRPEAEAAGVALLDAGVVGTLERCRDDWCEIAAGGYSGWLQRSGFYGLYPGEKLE
ncbi:SH3 domain-containing protein [Pelagibius litoralis]|uniref:SH3 domain-containing protein n=2 Tax=Pelagibius litoralis TaxID=374515 RepID=A0A967F384_9PROT|nr:SH3 domain-containing protein [Pelagibius litoralis]